MKNILLLLIISALSFPIAAQKKLVSGLSDFTEISFRTGGKLYLRQGSPQKVEIEGEKDMLEETEVSVEDGKLIIKQKGKWNWGWENNDDFKVYITVPRIELISAAGSGDILAETKITSQHLSLKVSGSGSIRAEIDAGDVEADVTGSGKIEMNGICKNLESDVTGSGKLLFDAQVAETVDLGVSGSGKIQGSGKTKFVKTSVTGSGKVLAADLVTEKCEVRISGSGDVEINVVEELTSKISGSGDIRYKGEPKRVNNQSSGSGSVRKM